MPTDPLAPESTLTTDALHSLLTATVEPLLTAGQFDAAEAALHRARAETSDHASAAHRSAIEFGQSLLDLALGRLRRARDAAGRAVEAAQEAQDLTTEISALAVQSLASARIGQPVVSLELALLATELAARTPSGPWTLRADIALAHAYLWNANIAMARRTLDRIADHADRADTEPALPLPAELFELSTWIAYRNWIDERAAPQTARPELAGNAQTPSAVLPASTQACVFPGQQETVALLARFHQGLRVIKGEVPVVTDAAGDDALSRHALDGPEALPALLHALTGIERGYHSRNTESIRDHLSAACIAANVLESDALGVLARQAAASALLALNARDLATEVILELAQIEQQRLSRDLGERRLATTTHIEARANAQANRALRAHTLELEKLAYEDSLTGVANKRRFEDRIGEWLAQAYDAAEPFSVALIDLDRFKQINDVFGHEMGDLVLKEVGAVLCANVRERDLAARIGGDEFALLFRGTTDEVGRLVCDRIEAQVRSLDWASIRAGLRVGLSIGVAEAQPADNPKSFLKRADDDMYQRKRARKHLYGAYRDRDEEAVSPIQIESVARRLQAAETVSVLVGSGYAISQNGLASGENFYAWRSADRKRFASAAALRTDPTGFRAHWNGLRTELQRQPVPALFSEVEKLYRALGCPWIMTERTDEWLQRAGVPAPIELFGSLFKDACGECGVPLSDSATTCPHCRGYAPCRRPAITLLDELPDDMVLNEAQLRAKRSDVILVVESDLTLTPTRSLIEKARSRGAIIVMLGSGPRASMDLVDECVLGGSMHVVKRLAERLARSAAPMPSLGQLSSDGAAAHAFLVGYGKDHAGRSLQRILEMSDLDYCTAPDLAGWQFPLLRKGRNCPLGPAPTPDDFAIFAQDAAVIDAMRRSFARTLAVLGLEWVEGEVCKAGNWERRFDWWANRSGDHDYRISRMIESLSLVGLKAEASAVVRFMEQELPNHRYVDATVALWHWKHAAMVEGG
ncbi:diguanylate cyclase [Niveibacterium sp. COAC-50]|uniref:diguanylate cyclase n=1 Tax=Niveibacterium sp. COAC-50 TaxID=2729384 RepID=UPI0015516E0A|nr:diguanylate cyclase [Niveibacterium sp. COAC-50]